MKVDFFKDVSKRLINDRKFGICDDNNKKPAYIKLTEEESWIATVVNNNRKEIIFTAIDNCIDIFNDSRVMDKRCDAMLTYDSSLMFVELKVKRDNWKSAGLQQIEAVVKRMIEEEKEFYYKFTRRKAIVANPKYRFPCFEVSDKEKREIFNTKYKMRIQFESEIEIR